MSAEPPAESAAGPPADGPSAEPPTDGGPPADAPPAEAREPAALISDAQRRRLAAVFGDALPDTTGDERDPVPDDNEAQLLADRPPHHDR